MASINLESLPPNLKSSVAGLIRGREAAVRLAIQLQEALPGSEAAMDEVIGSISRGISALGASGAEVITAATTASPCSLDGRNVSSGGNRKVPMRRGAYRRRGHPYSWTKITSKSLNDGFTWRKYGQKEIYGAKFQRSYYRCTHKPTGCPATRQVQQSEEDPSTFDISYMGEHTCRKPDADRPPYLISFASAEGGSIIVDDGGNLGQSSSFPSVKGETADEQVVSSQAPTCSSCSEYAALPSAVQFEGSAASTMQWSDNSGDVTSCFHSDDAGFDMMFDVDELLNLDHDGLF